MFDPNALPMVQPETRWRAPDLLPVESIHIDIDFSDIAARAEALARKGRLAESIDANEIALGAAQVGLDELSETLRSGRGIAIVPNFPVDLAHNAIELVFWRCGLALGTPVSQSVMGDRLGHVIDVTKTDPHARAYRRNEKLTPHTDPADFLSFLCLQPAAIGGESLFISALEVHEMLRAERPDLLERMYRGYRWSRFGEQADDEDPITPHHIPVFSERDGLISTRALRQYVEIAADEDPTITLDALDIEAFDVIDEAATNPDLALRFTLERGQAIFANNYTVWHARTGFEDIDGSPPRHLLRLWIDGEPRRPVVDRIQIYPGTVGIRAQPGRMPSYETTVEVI
ncbi:MAG: TauD/TfdA family dioxygenase [Acidimicrobiia bacterium]|nr:TauD/TfdA family dioxygenase [Acidimicrobiia bacterium]